MLWSLSWKNIWRNKLRSTVVIIAVALGVFAGIFLLAFTNGVVEMRIASIIRTEISHIQIHHAGFLENADFSLRIPDAENVLKRIRNTNHLIAASQRIVINSMVASAETNTGVKIIGIVPEEEGKVTNIREKILVGSYFSSTQKNGAVIGKKLAEKLKVGLSKKIILTIQDSHSNITSGAFRVEGIYETDNNIFDESTIFVKFNDLTRLSALKGTEAHEIAVLLDEDKNTEAVRKALRSNFPDLEIKDWLELSPEAGYLVSIMDQYMAIFMLVILLALCFGIINTMLMVVLERIKEIGMLMAVGMSKLKIFLMVMLETVYLTLTGGTIGIVVGYTISKHLERVGLDLYFWKEVYSSIGYSSMVYPKVDFPMIALTTLMIVITGIISAIYPAFMALKLNPVSATKNE